MAALREETLQIRHQMVRMTNSDKLTRGETHFLLFINARHVKIHYCKQFCNNKNPCKMKAPNWKKFCTSMGSLLVNLPNEWRSLKPPIASTSMLSGRKMEFYSIHRCCRKKVTWFPSCDGVFSGQRISKWLETWHTTATAALCQKQFFSLRRESLRLLKPAFISFSFTQIRFLTLSNL